MRGEPQMDYRQLDACVRGLRREMVDFTSELVGIASENPPGNAYPACVRAIESRLRALGLPCDIVKYRPARGRSATIPARPWCRAASAPARRTLYFSGHYDVVPVTTPGQCAPVQKGKTLFGRGRRHEGRPGRDALCGGGAAAAPRAARRTRRPGLRSGRGDGRAPRLGISGGDRAPGHGRHRHADARAHERRRLEREPRRDHHARHGARTRGPRRTAAPGPQRVRGRDPRRRRPAAPGPARGPPPHAVPRDAGGGAPIADAHRRPRRGRIELQRRARPLRVHGRPAHEPGGRLRRRARRAVRVFDEARQTA